MTKVKICGITNGEHALATARAGADFIGLVLASSRRQVTPEEALPLASAIHSVNPHPEIAGVFVNFERDAVNRMADDMQLDWVQLSGNETWQYCREITRPVIKVIHIAGQSSTDIMANVEAGYKTLPDKKFMCLLDTSKKNFYGGTGETFDWTIAKAVAARFQVIIAGGLTPDNVGPLIEQVRPWGVDVSSGVETNGQKDVAKINAFIQAVRKADNALRPGK
jgi:phosphoribosylanthranilate isomerase